MVRNRPIDTTPNRIENAKPNRCQRMKSICGTWRMTISGLITIRCSQRDFPWLPAAQPADDLEPGHQDCGKQRGQDADAQGHREPLYRAGAQPIEEDAG